jgi:hypothetical protein
MFKNFKLFILLLKTIRYELSYRINLIIYKVNVLICIYFNRDKIYIHDYNDILEKYNELRLFYNPIKLNYINSNQKKTGKTTAVIFNSGLKNFQNKGKEIDSHDYVIRINLGTGIFDPIHLGTKTSYRVLGKDWIYFDGNEILARTYNNISYYENDKKNLKKNSDILKNGIFVFNHDLLRYYDKISGGMMSNGMRSVLLGLSISDSVIIYGADNVSKSSLKQTVIGDDRHYPSLKHKEYFINWGKKMKIDNNLETYFDNTRGAAAGKGHNLHVEYFFYKSHPRILLL